MLRRAILAVAVVTAFAASPPAALAAQPLGTDVVQDGSFEEAGPTHFTHSPSHKTFFPPQTIGPWKVSAGPNCGSSTSCGVDLLKHWYSAPVPDGDYNIDMNGSPGPGELSQPLATEPGATYRVSFSVSGNPLNEPASAFRVAAGTYSETHTFSGATISPAQWKDYGFDVTTGCGTSTRLVFTSMDAVRYGGWTLDDVKAVKTSQADADGDGVGDACDSTPNGDTDNDGVDNRTDNCPIVANPGQENADGSADSQGDACDTDADNDGVEDLGDNCRDVPNPGQENTGVAEDGIGDACDDDADNDGIVDGDDNCRDAANTDQVNFDRGSGDADGDVCDGDIDGDATANEQDAFDFDPTEDTDTDGDGIGDNSDPYPTVDARDDADNDGIADGTDNCVNTPNNNQADLDRDGDGDVCDGDRDGDGVPNGIDNAPDDANADQADLDNDGIGDVKDPTVLPSSSSECKKDGWTRFYDGSARFNNQGDCVSFIATGGKNLPAGS